MVEQRPVQTSAVYLLGPLAQFPAIPPPSPPSPVTPETSIPCTPLEELNLDDAIDDNNVVQGKSHDTPFDDRLSAAVHVLTTEAAALSALSRLYSSDFTAREGFSRAVATITRSSSLYPGFNPGKLVLIGVGKSGHIARKLTATFNSLSIPATFLHPTEALHGDLGVINRSVDTLMLITYSGNTPELTAVLPHLDPGLPLVLLTGAKHHGKSCDVVRLRPDAIVVPAPVHELETSSFGVAAPTTSTTAALAVGDALALVCAQEMNPGKGRIAGVFARNHPGGAIGAANTSTTPTTTTNPKRTGGGVSVRTIATPWKEIPLATGEPSTPGSLLLLHTPPPLTAADILRAGYTSPSGWVRVCHRQGFGGVVSPGRIKSLRSRDLGRGVDESPGLVVRRCDFVSVAADTTVSRAADWVREMMRDGDGEMGCRVDSIVGILEGGECVGVLEVGELLAYSGS